MIPAVAQAVADAVLYEGYMLYPYRSTALKNSQRWTFGGLNPQSCCDVADPTSGWLQQAEFLVQGELPRLEVTVRFLHVHSPRSTSLQPNDLPEAIERTVHFADLLLSEPGVAALRREFHFAEAGADRTCAPITGNCELNIDRLAATLFRIRVTTLNLTEVAAHVGARCGVYPQTMAAVHAVCRVIKGEFISLTDPPDRFGDAARGCRNLGVWPVLVGDVGSTDVLLCSPIILGDYPQIAAASPGDLFDAAEIDEILTLRIRTLTEDEKQAVRGGDDRVRRLLERSESLSQAQLLSLHAQMRSTAKE